ncbi:Protein YeeZ [Dyadobacter sp. CECT 9275]|uniref:Protein YeeZ n=1 Tax=Dyadobacter helix TaxID=2822344 RepID=A0A916JJ27_9BACT|nr:NAD-dependent dehydratase [Dyadobacter sp. CECT 9275]CAG5009049.1 Protein YeeZ [Dyadobacter sp. CECT 9275]
MPNEVPKIEKKRVSILGCGWLGFPLAQRLSESPIAFSVQGSTTTPAKIEQLRAIGVGGFLLTLHPEIDGDSEQIRQFFETDMLVISIPPRLSKSEAGNYAQQIRSVAEQIKASPVREVIFISSTGVYPDLNRIVTEDDVKLPEESASPEMVSAENIIQTLRPQRTVSIVRLSGLLGYNRIPGKYVQGQKDMTTGSIPVNYIHRDDAAGVILEMIKTGIHNETFNIVAPIHTSRRQVYEKSCEQFGWELPTFKTIDPGPDFKIISGEKFSRFYRYNLKYPDPLDFFYAL